MHGVKSNSTRRDSVFKPVEPIIYAQYKFKDQLCVYCTLVLYVMYPMLVIIVI